MWRIHSIFAATCAMALGAAVAAQAAPVALPVSPVGAGATWAGLGAQGPLLGVNDATSPAPLGGGDHFDDAMGVRVGGAAYSAPATMENVGNKFTGNSQTLSGLGVVVEFMFDTTKPVARQIVELTNSGGSTVDTTVTWINNTGNDSAQRNIGTSSGDLVEGLDDRWIVTADSSNLTSSDREVNTWILYGPDGPSVTTSSVVMSEAEGSFGFAGSEGLTAGFDVSVAPGDTQYLMWFVGINGRGQDGLDLATVFDDTSNAMFLALVSDLSTGQLDDTVNWAEFTPGPGPSPIPEPATLTLLGVGLLGLGWARRRRKAA